MDREQLKAWLDAYGRAWETRDPEAVGKLFSKDATYQETPFAEPLRGREAIVNYWSEKVQQRQEQPRFGYEILAVNGALGIAHWWASFIRIKTKIPVKLDGIFLLRLGPGSLCSALREWWVLRENSD
jgi:SnoaL-like protein